VSTTEGGRKRRRHSAEFKAKVVAVCRQPGMSMAAVALAHGLNANLLRRWVVDAQQRPQPLRPVPLARETAAALPSFVALPLPVPSATATPTPADPIRIELKRGEIAIHVQWPLSAAAQCAAWVRELL
jgi:transposase-like protein